MKTVKVKHIIVVLVGILLVLLGGLWFLQGSDIVHIKPILCASNCAPITGHAPQWQIIGLITFAAGATLVFVGLRPTSKRPR